MPLTPLTCRHIYHTSCGHKGLGHQEKVKGRIEGHLEEILGESKEATGKVTEMKGVKT